MSYNAKIIKLLIASPGDTIEARQAIWDSCHWWNSLHAESKKIMLQPIMWERDSTPELGESVQQLLNKQLVKNCDILVATFWTRLGTPTLQASSGTVEEINEFLNDQKPVLLYFSTQPVKLGTVDQQQWKALEEFKLEMQSQGLIMEYNDIQSFTIQLQAHLLRTINNLFTKVENIENSGNVASKNKKDLLNQLLIFSSTIQQEWDNKRGEIDNAKEILSQLVSYLMTFNKTYSSFLDRKKISKIENIISNIDELINTELYLDGGKSYNNFWKHGSQIVRNFVLFSSRLEEENE